LESLYYGEKVHDHSIANFLLSMQAKGLQNRPAVDWIM